MCIKKKNMPDASKLLYVMEKRVAMSLVVARLRLKRAFPIIGVPPSWKERCIFELIERAVIASDSASSSALNQWTDFRRDVLTCSVDVHLPILETVCSRLDLRWHGRIAAAYVQRSTYIFLRIKVVDTCGYKSEHVASRCNAGFIAE